jgi:flagellar basal body rod protein FlgG
MTTILGAAASGLQHYQTMLDAVAFNLSNVNTESFHKLRVVSEGTPTMDADPAAQRLGVGQTTLDRLTNTGAFGRQENPLQFAIQDEAFFVVQGPGGPAYTRAGALGVDGEGNILAPGGHQLAPAVKLPDGYVSPALDGRGQVTAVTPEGETVVIGQLSFAKFDNPAALAALGQGLFQQTDAAGAMTAVKPGEDAESLILGSEERSNVDTGEELTNMILAQRAYQANLRAFTIGDEMLKLATNLSR